jgi:CO/xanthine dehydrogenase FAD-binding subunit
MAVTVKTVSQIGEAAQALGSDRGARVFSGGTLLMRALNEGDLSITSLIRVTDPSYRRIASSSGRIEIGAGARMVDILNAPELSFLHPVARIIGGPAVRSMATVGGNLYAPAPYGDFAVALLALDAQVSVQAGFGAPRPLPIEQFLAGRDRDRHVVASVSFARPDNAASFRFAKVTRVKPKGISVLSIAAHIPGAPGRIANARVAYGAMAPTPIRAKGAERALEGRPLDESTVNAACASALEGTSPPTDAIASEWYRREVLPVHLKRLLLAPRT